MLRIRRRSGPWEGEPSRGPLKKLLTRNYARGYVPRTLRAGREQQIIVRIVNVQGYGSGKLVSGGIQCHSLNRFYETRKLHAWSASNVKRGGGELVVAGPNPLAVSGGHELHARRSRG